jgi:hypothetical protein
LPCRPLAERGTIATVRCASGRDDAHLNESPLRTLSQRRREENSASLTLTT